MGRITNSDKAFVREVIRIIKEISQCRFKETTIILVSSRFYRLAKQQVTETEELLLDISHNSSNCLLVVQMTACPASWLRDYEFEIRPYGPNTMMS